MKSNFNIATQAQIKAPRAINHREPFLLPESDGFKKCLSQSFEKSFWEFPALVKEMNFKIALKYKFTKSIYFDVEEGAYDEYLRHAYANNRGEHTHVVINPFDFRDLTPSRAMVNEIYKRKCRPGTIDKDFAYSPGEYKQRFLTCIESLDFNGDTILAYETMFSRVPS
ncbi:hypothetical protein OXX79_009751 [Metschnikowia pulcherrima]